MAEQNFEQVSAFMDGELKSQQMDSLINNFATDEKLRDHWERYHLIGDALRNNLPGNIHVELADRVSQALKDEPTVLSPTAQSPSSNKLPHKKLASGYAIAASVAVLGFMTVGVVYNNLTGDNPRVASVASPSTVAQTDTNAIPTHQPSPTLAQVTPNSSQAVVVPPATTQDASKLRPYVINHESSASSGFRRGLPPNVRLVTFSAQQR